MIEQLKRVEEMMKGKKKASDKNSSRSSGDHRQDSCGFDDFARNLKKLLPSLEALYKYIHSHPELSMQETRTAGIAAERLRAAGYEVATGVGKTGVVGLLRNGDGPTVMLRADMTCM
jgi:hippurate hydrolase